MYHFSGAINDNQSKKYQIHIALKVILLAFSFAFSLEFLGFIVFMGKVWTGLLMLITLGGFLIWSVVDLVLIIIGEFKDKSGRLVKYEHPQIRK